MSVALSLTITTRHGVENGVSITAICPLPSGVRAEVNVQLESL